MISWDEPKQGVWRAFNAEGLVLGRVFKTPQSSEFTASARGDSLGTYISEEYAKAAVERCLAPTLMVFARD